MSIGFENINKDYYLSIYLSIKLQPCISPGKGRDEHVSFGIGFNKIVGVLISDFDKVVTHQVGVKHVDFIRGKVVEEHLQICNLFGLDHVGALRKLS